MRVVPIALGLSLALSVSARAEDLPRLTLVRSVFSDRGFAVDARAGGDTDLIAKKGKAAAAETPAPAPVDDAPAEDKKPAGEDGEESSTALPDKEVKVGGTQLAEDTGGATGFVFKQGFYTQSDLGGFFRFGGFTIAETCDPGVACQAVFWSNLQPFIGLSAGYDLFKWLGIQLSFGTGFVANAAPYGNSPYSPRDYGVTFVNLGVVGSWYFLDRLALAVKLFGGGSFLVPAPDQDEPFYGGNAGVGLGIRYATLLPDTFIGFDVNFHAAMSPGTGGLLFIPAISFAPVLKYVF
jgi:hypothetical protein